MHSEREWSESSEEQEVDSETKSVYQRAPLELFLPLEFSCQQPPELNALLYVLTWLQPTIATANPMKPN